MITKQGLKLFDNFPKRSSEDKLKSLNECRTIWQNYARARQSLLKSEIIRTQRSPEADFSEWLVKIIYNGNLNYKSNEKGSDLTCQGKVIEVKSLSGNRVSRFGYEITEEDRKNDIATHFVFVFFTDFVPKMIVEIKIDEIRKFWKNHLGSSDIARIGKRVDTPGLLEQFSP